MQRRASRFVSYLLLFAVLISVIISTIGLGCGQPAHRVLSAESTIRNPFSPATTIEYSVPDTCHVSLTLYNITGKTVAELVDTVQVPGVYKCDISKLEFYPTLPDGVYFYKLEACGKSATKKMVLLK
jgi:hypothetical protein